MIYLSSIKKNKLSKITEVIEALQDFCNASENSSLFKENEIVYETQKNSTLQMIEYKGTVEITLSNGVNINTIQLPRELLNEIKKHCI